MFLHAGLIHLALNSYVLWIFGVEIERQIGRLVMLAVFLVTGVFAGATSFAFAPGYVISVGASGAIFGLVGAFIAYNYLRRQHVMAQARLRGALTMLLINLVIGFSIPGIDWRAHVGGLVAGLVAGFAVDPSRPAALRRTFATVGLVGTSRRRGRVGGSSALRRSTRTRRACCPRRHDGRLGGLAIGEPVEVALASAEVDPTAPDGGRGLDAIVEVQLPEQPGPDPAPRRPRPRGRRRSPPGSARRPPPPAIQSPEPPPAAPTDVPGLALDGQHPAPPRS